MRRRRRSSSDDRAITYAELDRETRAWPPGSWRPASRRVTGSGSWHAERHRLGRGGVRDHADRRRARPAQHAPTATGAGGAAAHGERHRPDRRPQLPGTIVRRRARLGRPGRVRGRPRGPFGGRPVAAPRLDGRRRAERVGADGRRGRHGGAGRPGRRPGDHVHLGQPGRAQGRDPHTRRRPARHRRRPRRPPHRARRSPLHPDAVLLGGRLRRWPAVGPPRRGDAAHRGGARTRSHLGVPRARAGHAVPRLARPGGPHRRRPRLRRRRPVDAAAGEPRRRAATRSCGPRRPGRARTCSG